MPTIATSVELTGEMPIEPPVLRAAGAVLHDLEAPLNLPH
jgi:hypothetical protein